MKRTNASFAYRLAAHCKLEGDCIVYLGVPQNKGYPVLTANHKHYLAHRLAYEVFVGPIPKGMWVLHKCDNRACIKPDHLWLGTPKDNIDDMMRKGRSRPYFAEQNPRAKLTYMQAQEIRRLHHKSISQAELSKMYDVSDSTINAIIHRIAYTKPPKQYPTHGYMANRCSKALDQFNLFRMEVE